MYFGNMDIFTKELTELINKHSKENLSNTPDFILADYLVQCLLNFSSAVNKRETWYAKEEKRTKKHS